MPTGAQLLVESLKAYGVDVIFGIPGIHNLAIYDALVDEPSLRVVTTRDERGAAHMADGFARATGRPGVCLTVPGPGVTNALTAIGEAYADSSPLLFLATQLASTTVVLDREDFHQLRDSDAVLRSVTQWGARPVHPEDIGPAVDEAFRRFGTVRPRPVYLDLPMDLLNGMCDRPPSTRSDARTPPAAQRSISPPDVERSVEMLVTARRPLLLLGGGAWRAAATVRRLLARMPIPTMMTSSGKGIVPEDHQLSLGDGWMAHQLGREALEEADVILAVGVRFGPLTTSWWTRRIQGELIHVDLDPTEIGKHTRASVAIVADATCAMDALLTALGDRNVARKPWLDAATIREQRRAAIRERAPDAVATLEGLRRVLPDDALVFNDINGIACWGAGAFLCRQPRTFHYPIGFGCLGFALPAAIGAKLARPQTPVVVLSGDGGFLFTGHELATAVHERVGIVAVVFNDHAYGTIKSDQQHRHPGRSIGGDLRSPDFVRYAEAFGATGYRVDSVQEVPQAVAMALGHDRPTLIEAPCPQALPPWIED
jgi:acetolactate synthase-1/2/3 large subunit